MWWTGLARGHRMPKPVHLSSYQRMVPSVPVAVYRVFSVVTLWITCSLGAALCLSGGISRHMLGHDDPTHGMLRLSWDCLKRRCRHLESGLDRVEGHKLTPSGLNSLNNDYHHHYHHHLVQKMKKKRLDQQSIKGKRCTSLMISCVSLS